MCVRPSVLSKGGTFPCGQCVECRLKYSREWAMRAVHEASFFDCDCAGECMKPLLHGGSCSLALTYDDKSLPRNGSLDPLAPVLFLKRLRKSVEPKQVRHMYAGEYGDDNGRPHYHFIIFGHRFGDAVEVGKSRKGFPLLRSAALQKLWPFGLSTVGDMSFESAAYIARYIMKKQIGLNKKKYNVDADTGEMFEIVPEFFRMSRGDGIEGSPFRYGIGYRYFERYRDDMYHHDGVSCRGKLVKPPRYYDEKMKLCDAAALEVCKARRERKYLQKLKGSDRLSWKEAAARELIAVANLQRCERSL